MLLFLNLTNLNYEPHIILGAGILEPSKINMKLYIILGIMWHQIIRVAQEMSVMIQTFRHVLVQNMDISRMIRILEDKIKILCN